MFKIAILILISNISFAESFNAKYISNYDGDTVRLKFNCNTPYFCDNVSVRIYGIDAPEIRTKDFCEKKKSYEAKDFVKKANPEQLFEDLLDRVYKILETKEFEDCNVAA